MFGFVDLVDGSGVFVFHFEVIFEVSWCLILFETLRFSWGGGRGKRRRKEKKESANSEKRIEVMEVRAARWWSF